MAIEGTGSYRLTDDTKRAMKAVAQWKLGDREWGVLFVDLAESTDPIGDAIAMIAESEFGDDQVAEEILEDIK